MTARQLQHYKAVSEIDGPWWGTAAQAVFSADLCYTLASCHISKPGEWRDFLRSWDSRPKPKPDLSQAEAITFLKSLCK